MKTTLQSLDHSQSSPFVRKEGKPVIIAGPCSAETEDQMMATARQISAIPEVSIFRAGIWKPRTRPNAFEGVGEAALPWLARVKAETGMQTACEVATGKHVELALKYGVDILWVGARTTVNPFSVQEIADALNGVDIPVMVKNPVNPDLQLWLGALERLSKTGITKLAAIHRGFSTFDNGPYRNAPKWDMAEAFKVIVPEIPLLCDPSHIAGKQDLVELICQQALGMHMDGLMIETHHIPEEAWSDAAQQLTPAALSFVVERMLRPNKTDKVKEELDGLRQQIDELDDTLMVLLSERARLSEKIGNFKKANDIAPLQVKRWEALLQQRIEKAQSAGLATDFISNIFQLIHKNSIQIQNRIMGII